MNITPGQLIAGYGSPVAPPSFSPDGTRFVAGDLAGSLIVRERPGTDADAPFSAAVQIRVPPAGRYSKPEARGVVWSPCGSLIATHEYGSIHVRHAGDLADAVPPTGPIGKGPLALGGGGKWLASFGDGSVSILDFPTLENRRLHVFERGGFEYFWLLGMAVDPGGSLLLVSDDGGRDETAMAMVLDHGTPQVALFDVAEGKATGVIEQGEYIRHMAFDPWRKRILTAAYRDMGVWLPNGEPVRRFQPYGDVSIRSFAVTERWLITCPDRPMSAAACLDLWDAGSFDHLATAPIESRISAEWIVASPGGRTLLTPSPGGAICVWSISD